MKPVIYDFPAFTRGDWWDGIPFIEITINDEPPIFPILSARMQFRNKEREMVKDCELTTENGGIVIEDAARWFLSVPARSLPLYDTIWSYDIETTDTRGAVKTYIKGIQQVESDITR